MLSDLTCKALISESKRINKPLKKSDGKGLLLHAFPKGSAYWYHKYCIHGRQRQLSYGAYPIVALSEARLRHAESYKQILTGVDPLQLKEDEIARLKLEASQKFTDISLAWHKHCMKGWSLSHAENIMRRLQKNLFPALGSIPINRISRKQFLDVIRSVEKRSPSDARRCVQYGIRIFNYAMDEELVTANIILGMGKSLTPQKHGHFASMNIGELPKFLHDLENNVAQLSKDRQDAIRLLMLTVVRPNELVKAEWAEFDFEKSLWTVPKERMKMRSDHIVPLSSQAKAILLERWEANIAPDNPYPQSKFVFPSKKKANQPMAHNTICEIIIDMGWKGRHSGHGFRALFMGIAKEVLKYRHEVPDRQLAHQPKGNVNRAYDRAQFLDERKNLMRDYADYINSNRSSKAD